MRDSVRRSLYGALCEGKLRAIGDVEDREGKKVAMNAPIPALEWKRLSEADFAQAVYRERVMSLRETAPADNVLFVTNVRIETAAIDKWLSPQPHVVSKVGAETKCEQWLRSSVHPATQSASTSAP